MARGNLIQGQGSGKVGDIVLMVRNGQQVSRVYTTSGARSGKEASEASRIQRVKFGGASNQWGVYRYICTRMFRKGRSSKQSDYNYFVKKNNILFPYFTKEENASGVHILQPGIFSEGNLGRINLLYRYNREAVEGSPVVTISTDSFNFGSFIDYTQSMAILKARFMEILPNAKKVTYLFSVANEIVIQESGESFASQQVTHHPVIIDLYDEVESGENELTIAQYFSQRISNSTLSAIIAGSSGAFGAGNRVCNIFSSDATAKQFLSSVNVLMFATDDNASDCYTTILPESNVDPTAGVFVDWFGYRSSAALKVASISYGFQSGVMRDSIASYGNSISEQVTAYAAALRALDVKEAEAYLKSVGDLSQVQAKVVRKATEEKK